jgi:hypothetical protein
VSAPYRVCTRCIVDTSVPGARFDDSGGCSYCKIHDRLERQYPLTPQGEKRLSQLVDRIKAAGRSGKYDCVVGVSGGRDSIYTLWLTRQMGLRPVAVHFNDGFGNPVAGENMTRAVAKLGVDLRTVTSDWRESKDLKLAFLKSSTPDLEQGTDFGIYTALLGTAARERIRFVISGFSFRTEGVCPLVWITWMVHISRQYTGGLVTCLCDDGSRTTPGSTWSCITSSITRSSGGSPWYRS